MPANEAAQPRHSPTISETVCHLTPTDAHAHARSPLAIFSPPILWHLTQTLALLGLLGATGRVVAHDVDGACLADITARSVQAKLDSYLMRPSVALGRAPAFPSVLGVKQVSQLDG